MFLLLVKSSKAPAPCPIYTELPVLIVESLAPSILHISNPPTPKRIISSSVVSSTRM